ncbi:MAG: hypothetical protein V1899_08030 [Planctomycetota bacterium]
MIRLRTLGGVALFAGIMTGLTGCGNRKGDLGAEREERAPVIRMASEGLTGTQAAFAAADNGQAAQIAEAVELSDAAVVSKDNDAAAEFVALDRKADKAIGDGETKADGEVIVQEVADGPKPAETPTPQPTVETPEQKAERLLKDAERLASVNTQASAQEAEASYQVGLKLFNDLEYEESKKYFERAVALDPVHEKALQKLRIVNALLGIHADRMARKIRELEESERVKVQESVVALGQAIEEARLLEERGSTEPIAVEKEERERLLAEQLDHLRRAQDRCRRVKEIINWMPPTFDLPGGRAQVDVALIRVREKIKTKQDEIDFLRRVEAQQQAENSRVRETELFKTRIVKLLEQTKDLYDMKDYKSTERLALRILQLDPFNSAAESWKTRARSACHSHEQSNSRELQAHEVKRSWEDVDEASISFAPIMQYPSNWDQISHRSEGTSIGRQVKEETWKADIKKKLQKKVTFEWTDTSLEDAIKMLRDVTGVTMVIDRKVLAGGPVTIPLRVNDMSADVALDWALKQAGGGLGYTLRDNAIFISKEANLQEAIELKIYDVSDMTHNVPDFPGPDLQLVTPGDQQNPGGGAPPGDPFGQKATAAAPTLTNIADMIRNRIRPECWDPALGTVIEERAGKLVVMQKPEIHALIDQLLSNFRSTQRMMINIESRFLRIRESYMEDIGVEFQGLDPNVLTGDFGDVSRLGGPNGMHQPRVGGAFDATPPNVPLPGFVNGPDRVLSGSFSQVGSIINHVIDFRANDPDTISGMDTINGRVIQGGLSAQVTILNNAQVQAFIKALAVRETASTLTAPRLTVFNTQRAHMFVAQQRSYVADYDIQGDAYDPVIRQFLTGVVLDVRPIVSSDRRYVTMELRPTVTTLVNFVMRQIDIFQIAAGAAGAIIIPLSLPIQFPELSIQRIRTTATVPDGGVLLLGGLYRNIKFNAENGVPFLSDLPVVGRLFRWNVVDNAKSNLSILISPRIIIFSEEEGKL